MKNSYPCSKARRLFHISLLAAFSFATQHLFAQQVFAFPGAEGAGKFTTGGRGTTTTPTTIFEVTNLNDDNSIGSLRYALQASVSTYPYRTVVFRISGTIHLTSKLLIPANTTIAGQTAPGDGICLADYPVALHGNNIIVRYIRFRMGDKNENKGKVDGSGNDDAFDGTGYKDIMVDHVTSGWSNDEALTIYDGDSTTIQWSFITEPLNYSYHFESGDADYEQHGFGGIWGGAHASFHHNLIAHVKGRGPRFNGIRFGVADSSDFRNNVIYDWSDYNTNGGEGGFYNVVNNYYKYGPSTPITSTSGVNRRNMLLNPFKQTSPALPYGKYYLNGNYCDNSAAVTADNWLGVAFASGSFADSANSKMDSAFAYIPVPTQTAQNAYSFVLASSGCSLPNRDTLDQRIVADVTNRTGRLIDVQGGYPHGTPYVQTINAWPALNSTTPPNDNDHDGMPDSWETANGSNPTVATDRNNIAPNGYTKLENYLNSIATNALIITGGSFNSFSQALGTPSAVQTYTFTGKNLTGDVTLTAPAGYEISADGTTWHNSSNPLTLTATNGTISVTTISVRLNAAVVGTYTGLITMMSNVGGFVQINATGAASSVTAIDPVAVAEGFSLYPNPVHDALVIKHPRLAKQTTFIVYEMDGKKITSFQAAQGTVETVFSTKNLVKGGYVVQTENNGKLIALNFLKL